VLPLRFFNDFDFFFGEVVEFLNELVDFLLVAAICRWILVFSSGILLRFEIAPRYSGIWAALRGVRFFGSGSGFALCCKVVDS